MSNVMDMLVKSGYEAVSIGNDVLPCTLKKGDELVGFLMEDFSVRLLPEHEPKRESINKAISFALDNQGLDVIQDEFKLSQYQDIILTTAYDFEEEKPIFNIYKIDGDKALILLNSVAEKEAATKDFATRSGLLASDIKVSERQPNRIEQFIEAIKQKGFSLASSVDDTSHAYDIVDQGNHVVGYIGKNNRVTITAENTRVKHALTDAYINNNANAILLPNFFEKLKERLKEIGLALKVIFSGNGRHYAIQNQQHKDVATVNEKHEITYTDQATKEQMTKINAMVEEIKRENHTKEQGTQQKEVPSPFTPSVLQPLTVQDVQNLTVQILSNPALKQSLIHAVLSDQELLNTLKQELGDTQALISTEKSVQVTGKAEIPFADSKVRQEFYKLYDMLQTLNGFNQEKFDQVQKQMITQFGATEPKEFEQKLQHGDYIASETLADKLKVSHQKADIQNTVTAQERSAEQAKEQQPSKERA